ncbi:unnamed protein product [Brassica napus]|uniref:(rape) hypothetical protein n=1 Tax=Brassica napus TaxID=3708 RepID=A0A816MI40_BRANA|nr:unnamed protein product [Brassica napus]
MSVLVFAKNSILLQNAFPVPVLFITTASPSFLPPSFHLYSFFLTIVAKTLSTGFCFSSIFLEQFFYSYLIHHPLSISAEYRLKMPLEYTPLSQLNSSQKERKIRVLVSRVWNYYSKNKPEVVLGMEAILVDEKVYTL